MITDRRDGGLEKKLNTYISALQLEGQGRRKPFFNRRINS